MARSVKATVLAKHVAVPSFHQSTQAATADATPANSKHFLIQRSNKEDLAAIRAAWPKPDFNIKALKDLLDHDNIEMRDKFRDFFEARLVQATV